MTDPDPIVYLEDIRREAEQAIEFLGGRSLEELQGDVRTAYAIIHALEIIGEAARRIDKDLRTRFADIPWRSMTGIRDKLIHGYRAVELSVVWETVTVDLPPLVPLIDRMLDELRPKNP